MFSPLQILFPILQDMSVVFIKLKLILSSLRASTGEDRLDVLALLDIALIDNNLQTQNVYIATYTLLI